MKVFHLSIMGPELDKALTDAGIDVVNLPWRTWMGKRPSPSAVMMLRQKALNMVRVERPEIVFMQLQTPGIMDGATVYAMRDLGAVVINWTGDVRDDIGWYMDLGHYVNATLLTNGTDIETMRAAGLPADYLQIGYDPEIYSPPRKGHTREGIVFLGNDYGNRFPESASRRHMVETMRSKFGTRFQAYGKGWGTIPLHGLDEVKALRNALVAINWDHYHRPLFASDRILRGQACGACMVSREYPGISDEHPLVHDCFDAVMMAERVDGLLSSPNITAATGERQAEYVRDHHTWHSRVPQIIQLANTYA